MPRQITHPYVRETALIDEDGKVVVIGLNPPGNTIIFRPKHGRESYTLSMQRAYDIARQDASVRPSHQPTVPKRQPDMLPLDQQAVKKMRIQKNLTNAIEKLVELVQQTEKIA